MFGRSKLLKLFLSENFAQNDILIEQKKLVRELQEAGISKRKSETKAQELPPECAGLSGSQSISYRIGGNKEKFLKKLNAIISVLGNGTRFQLAAVSGIGQIVTGRVLEEKPRNIQDGDFDNWLQERHVFSHAFTAQGTLRCTLMEGTPLYE